MCTLGARGLRIFRSSAMLCFFSLYPIRWPQTGICSITGSAHFGHPTRGMPASLPLCKSTHLCFVINDYFMGEVCLNYLNTVSLINLCTYIPSSIFFSIYSFIYLYLIYLWSPVLFIRLSLTIILYFEAHIVPSLAIKNPIKTFSVI